MLNKHVLKHAIVSLSYRGLQGEKIFTVVEYD